MRIEFAGRAPHDRKIRRGPTTAAALVLLAAALISGRRLPGPAFEVAPAALAFEAGGQNIETAPLNITVRNPDANALRIASVAVSGQMGAFHYTWNGCDGGTIPPKGQCIVIVTFRTTETAPQTALLQLTAANGGVRSVRLSG